jgi:lipid II:glycine glycyltransferase (peptidoglycan interpeptide bridge formation enzyme)
MNAKDWNKEIEKYAPPFGAFLQSYEWGVFQEALGREVKRIEGVHGASEMKALAIKMDLPLGQYYWFLPKGPLGTAKKEKLCDMVRDVLDEATFLRIEPKDDPGFVRVKDIHPTSTLQLDLTIGEDDLLAGMKSKTRYNIRLAKRKGVETRIVGLDHFDDFVRLLKQTSQRDRIRAHPSNYYKKMLEVCVEGEMKVYLAMAFFEGRPLAANIMIDFAGTRTYLHGASSNLHRNLMAPYALHWFLIEDAIKKGMETFDFWGIAPEDAGPKHPWAGITRYKKGYGGDIVTMPGTFDIPQRQLWYTVYKTMRRVRKILRK